MPIYEYTCQHCGQDFERLLLNLETAVDCPNCGVLQVRRRLSQFSFTGGGASGEPSFEGGGCGRCGAETPGQCQFQN